MLWLRGLCDFNHCCVFTLTFTYKVLHYKHLLPNQVVLETAVNLNMNYWSCYLAVCVAL